MTDLTSQTWDVLVIGTGIGGGVAGRRLAEAGLKVLFVERGPMGAKGEEQSLSSPVEDPTARRVRGFWPTPLEVTIDGRTSSFFGPIGAGVGGSSVFYGATLERPERHDLEATEAMPHPTGGWPVSYDAYAPFMDEAEAMFHVHGEADPLGSKHNLPSPPSISPGETALMEGLRAAGLHPYHAHTALKRVPGCRTCLGFKCPKLCKMDARSAGVLPALATGKAQILDNCKVTRLTRKGARITGVTALLEGQAVDLKARHVVLAAGALASPGLLMASTSAQDPNGIGNTHDLVGRNLMFHLTEMFALWPKTTAPDSGPSKSVAYRDHYAKDHTRLGMVQSMGIEASYGEITHYLNLMFDRSILRGIKALRQFTRVPAFLAHRLFGKAQLFAGILEDLPYRENRVLPTDDLDRLAFEYHFAPELLARRKTFRKAIKRGLRGHRRAFLTYQPELNFGHPCGTLVFGKDPATSVLDKNCRVHGLRNLTVADASFMPTSFGVNPSLMIAANALRVADTIVKTLGASRAKQ